MDAAKGLQLIMIAGIIEFFGEYFACRKICPTTKAVILIHQQITGCFPVISEQSGICITFQMVVVESIEIQVCQDIGIMYKKRLVALQQRTGFFDTTTGIQQFTPFVTDMNIHTEVLVCAEEVYNLTSKMVDVYGDIMEAGIF